MIGSRCGISAMPVPTLSVRVAATRTAIRNGALRARARARRRALPSPEARRMLPLSGLLFVRRRDRAQVFHHAHAKRRSRQRLTKYTDARLVRDNILGQGTRRHIRLPGPKIGRPLA